MSTDDCSMYECDWMNARKKRKKWKNWHPATKPWFLMSKFRFFCSHISLKWFYQALTDLPEYPYVWVWVCEQFYRARILWAKLVLTWRVRFVIYYHCFIFRFSWIELRFVGLPCAQDRPGGESKARRIRWSNAVQCTRDQARCVYIKLTYCSFDSTADFLLDGSRPSCYIWNL